MKTRIILIIAIAVATLFSACSKKANKDEVLNFYSKMTEYVGSEEFKNVLVNQKNNKDIELAIEKKMLDLAQALGYRTVGDMKATESVMKSPEVLDALKKFEEAQTKIIYGVAEQKNSEEIKKAETDTSGVKKSNEKK